jgi:CxxC-x17-CxxC domain-containing protein
MDLKYVDRLLTCSDCGGEFIFTAGEQLFFADKQFKNDPKRCKPCKSRRSGLAGRSASGPAAAGISRTETRTECSECGIETTVPFKPTQGRPVLCRQCFQEKGRAAAASVPAAARTVPAAAASPATRLVGDATATALTGISTNTYGAIMAPDAAVLASSSISNAHANSSVATAADLASITDAPAPKAQPAAAPEAVVPVNLVSAAAQEANVPAELIAAAAEAPSA